MQSGILAATQAAACFKQQDFSAAHLAEYDKQVAEKIGRKLAKRCRLMRFLSNKPWLVNAAVRLAKYWGSSPGCKRQWGK
jgi:flavin-dependent dehydrogenase